MKQLARMTLLIILLTPVLSGCGLLAEADPVGFDSLARLVPGDLVQTFFLDLKPAAEAGEYWQQFRNRLKANPDAEQAVDSLVAQFQVQELGLDPFIVGPAVSGYLPNGTTCVILQVKSVSAARDSLLLQNPNNLEWEHEEYQGKALYHHHVGWVNGQVQWRAFTAYDDLMVVATSSREDPIDDLEALVDLPQAQSLASLASWKTLRTRLPANPMGLMFLNPAGSTQSDPSLARSQSPGQALSQLIQGLALTAVPEKDGMRVEIAADLDTNGNVLPVLQRLLQLPGVDPGSWDSLPANTAAVISTHDAATVWPVLNDMFPMSGLDLVRVATGLDLEADLFSLDGPFSGDLALAITPPLPDQPISQGLTAGQLLLLGQGTSQAQMDALEAAMEGRGAILGSQTAGGIELRVQTGTELAGYAISFGFDDDVFVLGTSPTIVEQSASSRAEGKGLVADPIFQAVLSKMPTSPAFFFYLNIPSLIDLGKSNMTAQQYEQSVELSVLEVFDAIGLGLSFSPEGIEGTIHFYIREG